MKNGILYLVLPFFIILISINLLHAGPVEDYQSSWEHRALGLQRQVDGDAPLSDVLFLSTHNTYNASAYTTAFSYWDPNHYYSITGQLMMDIREIELDVHRYFSMKGWPWQWKTKLLLSHAQNNHTGASAFDRELSEGLIEIRNWITRPENENEILIIDIEDHMDGAYDLAVDIIQRYLGNLVYRPSGPQGLDMDLTKNEILATGKRIIIISGGDNHARWRQWVFRGVGDRTHFPQSNPENFRPYPDCGFSRDIYDNYLVRYFEDRTNLSAMFSDPGDPITPGVVRDMVRCGVNIISMDKLEPFDGRLRNAVWSWDVNEPNNYNNEDCAEMWGNGRWNDAACAAVRRFACKNPGTGEWRVTQASGQWSDGAAVCSSETGGAFLFDVPVNGYENQLLNAARTAAGASSVWLNLSDSAAEGYWEKGESSGPALEAEDARSGSMLDGEEAGDAGEEPGGSASPVVTGCAQPAHASTGAAGASAAMANLLSLLGMTLLPLGLMAAGKRVRRRR
jgi:hypothetical protein